MQDKRRWKPRATAGILSLGLALWLASPIFGVTLYPGTSPTSAPAAKKGFSPPPFRLAPRPLFTLAGGTPPVSFLDLSRLQEKIRQPADKKAAKVPSQIIDQAPGNTGRTEDALFSASLLAFAALNMADCVITMKALRLPGLEEANPVMQPFVGDPLLFSAVKLGSTALEWYLLKTIHKKNKMLGWTLSLAGNFLMGYIVSRNIRSIQSVAGK
ncbi:MAG: hypothetical protein JRI84_08520 [Deltaproteobacteria bacterium]|nr:hypothetical protein [Deltaproteobacteria bacterium]